MRRDGTPVRATAGPVDDPAPDPAATLAALRRLRPDLVAAYETVLPGARAAVLGRLWGALSREPIPGVTARRSAGGWLTVDLTGGAVLAGDAAAAQPFAAPPAGFTVTLDGRPYDDPADLLRDAGLPGNVTRLAAELANSVANLALARAAQPAVTGGEPALRRLAALPPVDALATVEQYIVDGHPLHPGCRTRLGMSTAEVLAYAPEHRPVVPLVFVDVPAGRWLTTGAGLPPRLPVHPWQRDHVLDAHPWLHPIGRHTPARPLMSLRTLAPLADPRHHLKTAVDVQMTSARRTVSPAAVHNGPAVTAVLAHLARRVPGFTALTEPAAGAAVVDGQPYPSLAVVLRRAPALAPGEVAVPLAALAAPSPTDGRPLAGEAVTEGYAGDPVAFFTALLGVLVPPLLALLAAGVALEAHGQNTLVVLRGGRPTRLLYRDVGGVRLHPGRLRAAGVDPPELHGDLATDDPDVLRTKLAASLGVALAEQVTMLDRRYGTGPHVLWERAVAAVRHTYVGLPRTAASDARAVLTEKLPIKATTAMRLAGDPLEDRWAWLPSPLAATP
ncbi:MAG TPA: IucA/IucC family protein [Pilimelia sp.]|nr:IucA/IucC family protein [Pilimelia sp.]